jgi:hypothetical protein
MGNVVLMRSGMKAVVAISMLMSAASPSLGAESDSVGRPTRYALDDVTITLEVPTCGLGRCASYAISIHGDGRVLYEGRRNVANIGQREAKIEPERVLELLNHIYNVGFFLMSDDYTYGHGVSIFRGEVVEVPYIATETGASTILVRIKGYQKRIVWLTREPQELLTIQSRIKEVSGVDRWLR